MEGSDSIRERSVVAAKAHTRPTQNRETPVRTLSNGEDRFSAIREKLKKGNRSENRKIKFITILGVVLVVFPLLIVLLEGLL